MGLGVVYVPEIFVDKPEFIQNMFASSISTGGLTAVVLSYLLPKELDAATEASIPSLQSMQPTADAES